MILFCRPQTDWEQLAWPLFNYLVGAAEERDRHGKAEGLGGAEAEQRWECASPHRLTPHAGCLTLTHAARGCCWVSQRRPLCNCCQGSATSSRWVRRTVRRLTG